MQETVRYNFTGNFEGRDSTTTKDQRIVNMFIETVNKERRLLVKRPGIESTYSTGVSDEGRGIWSFNGKIWYVVGSALYKNSTLTATTLATSTGFVGATACTISGTPAMFFCDGTDGYVIDNTETITKISDVDFPSPHVPTPVYIDGYVVLISDTTADVYNSDLEAPLSWDASNFITAEVFPDGAKSLARQNNQIVVFGENSTEFLYNAGNATGSPFTRNPAPFLQIGIAAPYAVGQNERYCMFIAQSNSGGRAVWLLDGFQPTKISTDAIERVLDYEGSTISEATALLLRLAGHFFYVINLDTRTFVYDIDEQEWHEWTSTELSPFTESQINGTYINDLVLNGNSSTSFDTTQFKYRHATDIGSGDVYLLHTSDGFVAKFDTSLYTDINEIIKCEINTPIFDFNTYKRKFLHRLNVVGDYAENNIVVKWSDNDYQTWSNMFSLDMSVRPTLHRLGSFRRRAFNITYTENYPLRLQSLEFVVSQGTT